MGNGRRWAIDVHESTVGDSVAMGIGGSSSIADEVVVSGMVKWVG